VFLLDDVDARISGGRQTEHRPESVQDILTLRPLVQVPSLVHEADEELVVPPPRSCVLVLHRADVGLACGQLVFFSLASGLVWWAEGCSEDSPAC
jgi:hypothetical protein